jgi:hypothetical protein
MAQFHLYFRNNVDEFYPHKTLSTPMKLLLTLSSLIQCHINVFNVHKTPVHSKNERQLICNKESINKKTRASSTKSKVPRIWLGNHHSTIELCCIIG